VLLATIGAATSWGTLSTAIAITGALALGCSMGLNGPTYRALYDWVLPYRGMRVPARFSVLFGSCLILLSAFGTRSLLRRFGTTRRNTVFAAIIGLVLLDLRVTTPLVDYWPSSPGIYQNVTSDMVLAEFPARHDIDYMYFSTGHWAHLIGGYSGFIPVDPQLDQARAAFPSPESLASLRGRGATHVTYNCFFELSEERCRNTLRQLDQAPSLSLVADHKWNGADTRLYRFR